MKFIKYFSVLVIGITLFGCSDAGMNPTGKWISTEDYKTTVEFFSDGKVALRGGISGDWIVSKNNQVRITASDPFGGEIVETVEIIQNDVMQGSSKENDGQIGKEYIRINKNHGQIYDLLKKAMDDQKNCLSNIDRAIEINEKFGRSYIIGGQCAGNDHKLALEYYSNAMDKELNQLPPWNSYLRNAQAWIMATSDQEEIRDAKKALKLAAEAVKLKQDCRYIDTEAAAYAANGDFATAIMKMQKVNSMIQNDQCDMKTEYINKVVKKYKNNELVWSRSKYMGERNLENAKELLVGEWFTKIYGGISGSCVLNANGEYTAKFSCFSRYNSSNGKWAVNGRILKITTGDYRRNSTAIFNLTAVWPDLFHAKNEHGNLKIFTKIGAAKITNEKHHENKAIKGRVETAFVYDPPSNVRDKPNGKVICSIDSKRDINITRKQSDWYKTDACGTEGVIHKSQIRVNSNTSIYRSIAEPTLSIRSSTNVKSEKIGKIPENDLVKVVASTGKKETIGGKQGEWKQIEYNGITGYVFDAFLVPN